MDGMSYCGFGDNGVAQGGCLEVSGRNMANACKDK